MSIVDFRNRRIYMLNCPCGEINDELQKPMIDRVFVNLSENYIDDNCMEQLMTHVFTDDVLKRIGSVDLSNNRMTQRAIKTIFPLFVAPTITKINLGINYFSVSDVMEYLFDDTHDLLWNKYSHNFRDKPWYVVKNEIIYNEIAKKLIF